MSNPIDAIAAETRAVEAGVHAIREAPGVYRVRSFSRPDVRHRVTPEIVAKGAAYVIRLRCTCESGSVRMSAPTPCHHAATVGRRLEREGRATWVDGVWQPTEVTLRRAGLSITRATG